MVKIKAAEAEISEPILIPRASDTDALSHPSAFQPDAQGTLKRLYETRRAFS